MNDIQLRLDCVRVASENLRVSTDPVLDKDVLEYAEKLFQYIWCGDDMKKAA